MVCKPSKEAHVGDDGQGPKLRDISDRTIISNAGHLSKLMSHEFYQH